MGAFLRGLLIFIAGGVCVVLAGLVLMATGVVDRWLGRPTKAAEWGRFNGNPKADLLDDGRALKLLEDFIYLDPRDKAWLAKKEAVVDGASIPRIFWTLVGGPLEGKYRNASVVHDTACDEKKEKWEDVHFMFYEACRCGGMDEYEAKVLYWAVYHGGPRWDLVREARQEIRVGPDGRKFSYRATVTRGSRPQARAGDAAHAEALSRRAAEAGP